VSGERKGKADSGPRLSAAPGGREGEGSRERWLAGWAVVAYRKERKGKEGS
jgi:hypothetical protein